MSVPVAKEHNLAATALADPPDDPPGTLSGSIGFKTFPKKLVSLDEPIANSSILVLPKLTVPELNNFS